MMGVIGITMREIPLCEVNGLFVIIRVYNYINPI